MQAALPPLPPLTPIQHCFAVCGFSLAQRLALQREGLNTFDDMKYIRSKDIYEAVKRINALPLARGGVHIGQILIRKLEAFSFWIMDQKRRSQPLDHDDFTVDVIEECLEKMNLEEVSADLDDKVKPPGKLSTSITGWIQWEMAFENYLSGVKGSQKLMLNYVIRKDLPAHYVHVTEESRLLYQIPLVGQLYDADNQAVYRILKDCIYATDAWEWIKSYDDRKNGRLSMQHLRSHYDGPAMVSKRLALANQQIKELHYKSEQSFPFESFITKLNGAYQVLADNGEAQSTRTKIEELLGKINSNHADIRSIIGVIRMTPMYYNDFTLTVNKLSEAITQIFPSQPGRDRRRVAAINTAAGRGRGYHGRGAGRGGRGRGGRTGSGGRGNNRVNGVDISNPDRYYTPEEWEKLPGNIRKDLIYSKRKNKNDKTEHGNPKRQVSQVQQTDDVSGISRDNTSPTAAPTANQSSNGHNDAGNSFGRVSYKKNKPS